MVRRTNGRIGVGYHGGARTVHGRWLGDSMVDRKLVEVLRSDEGQDLAEYAMLAVLIAVAVIAALSLVAPSISGLYTTIAAGL